MDRRGFTLACVTLLLSSCGGPAIHDHAPASAPDLSTVPDAIPHWEPRSRYGNPSSYVVRGKRYHVMADAHGYRERGIASWYGSGFQGRRTSSGEPYDMYSMSAAHKTLPLPTYVRVRNLDNGRQVVVRVNDRGPFHPGRLIDLSYAAASRLGMLRRGTAHVEVEALLPGTGQGTATVPPGPPPRSAPVERGYVQVGAFGRRFNAEILQRRLRQALGLPVRITEVQRHGGLLYLVQIGPLDTPAPHLGDRLERLGIKDYRLVRD